MMVSKSGLNAHILKEDADCVIEQIKKIIDDKSNLSKIDIDPWIKVKLEKLTDTKNTSEPRWIHYTRNGWNIAILSSQKVERISLKD